jgi:hypothetical protein
VGALNRRWSYRSYHKGEDAEGGGMLVPDHPARASRSPFRTAPTVHSGWKRQSSIRLGSPQHQRPTHTLSRIVRNLLMTPTRVKDVAEMRDRHDHPVYPMSVPT